MNEGVKSVDEALPAVRALLSEAAAVYRIVGGLAVVHHGYARTTDDIDVLIEPDTVERLRLAPDFVALGPRRLRHLPTGVRVDLLVAGDPVPRATAHRYPAPGAAGASPTAPDVIDLPGLLALKLRAHRYLDVADVVELLKLLSDGEYLAVEARVPVDLRAELARLREDALEETRGEE